MPNEARAANVPLWPVDTTAAKNAFSGDFHAAKWQVQYLTRVTPLFRMTYARKPILSLLVNRKIASSLLTVFNNIWNECDQANDVRGRLQWRRICTHRAAWNDTPSCPWL